MAELQETTRLLTPENVTEFAVRSPQDPRLFRAVCGSSRLSRRRPTEEIETLETFRKLFM